MITVHVMGLKKTYQRHENELGRESHEWPNRLSKDVLDDFLIKTIYFTILF